MFEDWQNYPLHILQLEQAGLVTRTFRRLDLPRQQAVVRAILEEAGENGPARVNIKQVAGRAGVALGSLYQYFPHRAGMLDFAVALCVRYFDDLFALSDAYLKVLPLEEGFKLYLSYGVEWSQRAEQAGFLRLFARAAYQGDPELGSRLVTPIATRMRQSVMTMLNAAAERGELRADLDLEVAGRLVNILLIALGDSLLLPHLNHYYLALDETTTLDRLLSTLLTFLRG